jgi:hypothetical protein
MPKLTPDNKHCASCGFLSVRHFQTRELLDAELQFREEGRIPWVKLDQRTEVPAYDEYPICFLRKIDFGEHIGRPCEHVQRQDALHRCCCDQHTPWKQGFTPREHWEMIQEEARLKWQAEREEADRAYRADNDRAIREFQAEQARLNREHNEKSLSIATKSADSAGRGTKIASRASLISAASVFVAIVGLVIGLLKSPTQPIIIQQPAAQAEPQATSEQ